MSCLGDRTILDLLHGGLDDVRRRRVEDELAHCARCAAVVGALLRDDANARREVDTTLIDLAGAPAGEHGEIDHGALCEVITRVARATRPTAVFQRFRSPVIAARAQRIPSFMRHHGRASLIAVLFAIVVGAVVGVTIRRIQGRERAEIDAQQTDTGAAGDAELRPEDR